MKLVDRAKVGDSSRTTKVLVKAARVVLRAAVASTCISGLEVKFGF